MEERLREFNNLIYRERNDMLMESDKRFREEFYNQKGRTLDTSIRVGDVVYLKKAEKHEKATMGIVEELKSETTCCVRTGKGVVTRMTLDCHPLVVYRDRQWDDNNME